MEQEEGFEKVKWSAAIYFLIQGIAVFGWWTVLLMVPGAELTVVEMAKPLGGEWWVKAQIPGRDPAGFLKIAGDELGPNFKQVR